MRSRKKTQPQSRDSYSLQQKCIERRNCNTYASSFPSLNTARYFKLKQMIAKQSVYKFMNLATLPPTSGSAKQHGLRAYSADSTVSWELTWLYTVGLGDANRCTSSSGFRKPICPPQRLLDLVVCNCKMGCKTASCKCRKAGRVCTPMCGTCLGKTCY